MRAEKHEIKPCPPAPPDPECSAELPEIDLKISSAPIQSKPRKLRMTASIEAADEMRDLWGGGIPGIERSAVDRMAAIGRGEPDPGPWIREPKPSAEEALFDAMAKEMTYAIDEEIAAASQEALEDG